MTPKDFDKLSPEEKIRRYFLARLLWWKHDLEELDADAVSQLMQVLEETRRDIRKRLLTEAGELAQVSEWTRERLEAVDQWAGEVLAGASATITETITVASATAATASLATYNAMLSFEGKAAAIQTVGMTPEQLRSWFQDTPLEGGVPLRGWVDKAFSNGIKKELLASLQQSGVEGKGTAEAVRRLMDKAVAVGAAITQREAVALARTYIQTANVGAMNAVYEKNKKIITQVEWCAVLDNRTCPLCFTGETEVQPIGNLRTVSKRIYTGEIVVITTSTGKKLEGTPNHPILTPNGWLSLDKIRPGDQVVNATLNSSSGVLGNKNVCVPTKIAELFDSVSGHSSPKIQTERSSRHYFHGDGMGPDKNINIVDTRAFLGDDICNPALCKFFNHSRFASCAAPSHLFPNGKLFKFLSSSAEPLPLPPQGTPTVTQHRVNPSTTSGQCVFDSFDFNTFAEKLNSPCCIGLADRISVASWDSCHCPETNKETCNSGWSGAELFSELACRLSTSVQPEYVVSVRREFKTCHVYNLHSCQGLYIANGLIVKNCATLDGRQWGVDEQHPPIPRHPRCRCLLCPRARSWRDFGVNIPDLDAVARTWVIREPGPIGAGGRKILYAGTTEENFGGWWATLPFEQQVKTIGPTRTNLIRAGKLKWDDLVDDKTGRFYTLEELGVAQ